MQLLQCAERDGIDETDLLDLYGSEIYKFCYSLTYYFADIEDLFQETFLGVILQRNKGKEISDPKKHLYPC